MILGSGMRSIPLKSFMAWRYQRSALNEATGCRDKYLAALPAIDVPAVEEGLVAGVEGLVRLHGAFRHVANTNCSQKNGISDAQFWLGMIEEVVRV